MVIKSFYEVARQRLATYRSRTDRLNPPGRNGHSLSHVGGK